jgi:cytochrome c-type biogenesis protein
LPLGELGSGFVLGIFATMSPCALPLYPGFLAYLAAGARGASTRWLGLIVLAGILTTMLALGALIAALSLSIGSVVRVVTPLADAVVIALGAALILGKNPFLALPMVGGTAAAGGALRSAYVYGLLYGPIALPCSAPLLVALFGIGLGLEGSVSVLLFFLAFGAGFGLPLVVLSWLARSSQAALVRAFTRHHQTISRLAGALLIAVGATDLANNAPFLFLSF